MFSSSVSPALDPEAIDVPVLTVGGISGYIESLLTDDNVLAQVWVTGELSSCQLHRNGHLYLTLQDPEAGDALKGVCWRRQVQRLSYLPEAGETIIALGQIGVYSKQSCYQLQIEQIVPGGEGLLNLRLQQLRDRLRAEGLFDQQRPLPTHPQCIAVVSSAQAAGWGDIQRTLSQRYPGLLVLLSTATVQGEQAPDSIARAIARVQQDGRAELLILGRGGGAAEDLACFNDERVVRAIVHCGIPVITGIGHERDETLADLAADWRAHTPTAAAKEAVPELSDLVAHWQDVNQALAQATVRSLSRHEQHLHILNVRLSQIRPDRILSQQIRHHQSLCTRLIYGVTSQLKAAQQRQIALAEHLQAVDPHLVLQRGYALVRSESEQVVKSAQDVNLGSQIQIQLSQGSLWARVEQLDPGEDNASLQRT